MNFILQIQAGAAPATLERILQAARVRGFHLRGLEVKLTADGRHYRLRLTVESELPLTRLTRQLERLVGVTELTALHGVPNEVAQPVALAP